jgi:hypothetical protein
LRFAPHLNAGAGDSDDGNILPLNLVFRFEYGKRFRIAAFDDDGGLAQFFDFLPGQIDGQIGDALVVPEEMVCLVRSRYEYCSDIAGFEPTESDHDTDFFIGQKFRCFFL